ncbi:hypothetical protein [Microvirga aerophila]|uniref:Uncharacterized protein n=1 Tax=Microvirga aerophila TaxID=670291 RepID=A0A512C4J6_9HYPH|nr:hypothetical protein [Microvirga aerophila]GEO19121.1 hypothetical protein MAE02_68170 [Microvirga aerophila]
MAAKWNVYIRIAMYTELVAKFGAHSTWESNANPGQDRAVEYRSFCEAWAKRVGATSGKAVHEQIRHSLPPTHNGRPFNDGWGITAYSNRVAAFEAKFITASEVEEVRLPRKTKSTVKGNKVDRLKATRTSKPVDLRKPARTDGKMVQVRGGASL